MDESAQVKHIRANIIETERNKLNTAQGKRIVPFLLHLQDNINDIEYIFRFSGSQFEERFYYFL